MPGKRLLFSKFHGCHARMTPEIASQIGGRIEVEHVGDLLHRHIGRGELMFDLHHDLPIDELLGCHLRDSGGCKA